ncbi:MAG: hypothetical protein WA428_10925 [Candidatus Cybelea sp.]
MAAPLVESMKDSAVASALRGVLRYTIVTAIVAIVGSSLLPVTDGERLATIVYLAVIFAAVTVTALHFVPAGAVAERPLVVTLPAALQSVLLVAIILVLGALFAGQPGAEGLLLLVCAALTAIAAFAGGGFSRTLHGELGAGGMLAALKRYSVLAGALALVLAMVLPAETKAVAVEAACWAVVAATIFLSVSLLGRTGFGRLVMAIFKVSPAWIFERTTGYAAYACAGALLVASLWPRTAPISTFCAYVAIVVVTIGVAVQIRLGLVADSRRATSISNPR